MLNNDPVSDGDRSAREALFNGPAYFGPAASDITGRGHEARAVIMEPNVGRPTALPAAGTARKKDDASRLGITA